MTKKITFTQRIALAFLIVLIAVLTVFSGSFIDFAHADVMDTVTAYENMNVLDDLKGSTIAGHEFNLDDYPYDKDGKTQIITFNEFGYSFYSDEQDDYGLYVCVYNPQCRKIDTNTERNKIGLIFVKNTSPKKYTLTYLNHSTQAGYEGLFYKFRVELSYAERESILNTLDRNSRFYSISEIELSVKQVVTAYDCAQTYTYSGYAQGYGSELSETDTLSCIVDGFDTYVNLDVHQTVFRAKGDFYNGEQSQLNSCYFRVPNRFFKDYGELTEVLCDWYEYLTKPILVTSDSGAYSMVNSLHGGNLTDYKNFYYLFLMQATNLTNCLWVDNAGVYYMTNCPNVDYNDGDNNYWGFGNYVDVYRMAYKNFAAAFFTGTTKYSNYTVSGDELKSKFLDNSKYLGGEKYCERYSTSLFIDEARFSRVLSGHTMGHNNKPIKSTDSFGVIWNRTQKDFWDNFYYGYTLSTKHEDIDAFHFVTKDDLKDNAAAISRSLYVDEDDVDDIKAEFAKAEKNGETLVLFRFSNSTYYSYPTVISGCSTSTSDAGEKLVDDAVDDFGDGKFSAYVFMELVFLDFDIISLTYTNDGVDTVIPVVCSPADVFSKGTPPLKEHYGNGDSLLTKIIKIILAILIIVLVVFLLYKTNLLGPVANAIWFVITAPVKGIAWIIKKIKSRKRPQGQNTAQGSAERKESPTVNVTVVTPDTSIQNTVKDGGRNE